MIKIFRALALLTILGVNPENIPQPLISKYYLLKKSYLSINEQILFIEEIVFVNTKGSFGGAHSMVGPFFINTLKSIIMLIIIFHWYVQEI
jgi:hypothetical protein